ncbi:MAG: retropepsin-like domain-containing protein [Acidobacteria bacterium]|nr:retropepsin-like domain-containing protein [Acidobacteriota bacterium]
MSHSLNFEQLYLYDTDRVGITISIELRLLELAVTFDAHVDTGASFCIFQRQYGEALGIDIESGERVVVGTATGTFIVYGHMVTLSTVGLEFDSMVFFASHEGFSRNVLGRNGWLNKVRFGLIEYEGKLFLSQY